MAKKMNNPRFPHFCRIVRITGATSFSDGTEELIYEGPCRRESSDNIRTFRTGSTTFGQVNYGDHRVSMPGMQGIRRGDVATVHVGAEEDRGVTVLHPNCSPLSTRDAPDGSTEFYYNLTDI